ncbi:peptidoglycan DD-metalloendopeptidase family protein [Chitinibacter bivalviorum]|uniref:Peptidoglycan DD-metalloendopeptidase family protein n=1 Tax=Chitinibacter bivalviorum TaxID=2739434 RepID=A0A7H9BME3_9NEIS|nr:peptidoglycan DD-metalloendopeptidase family protein [Chitinibacter bivalviorum]
MKLLWAIFFLSLLAACSSTPTGNADGAPAGFYRVKAGDTLYRIAKNNNQSVENIKAWNKLSSNDIEVGQLLRVSASSASVPAKPSSPAAKPATPKPTAAPRASINLIWPNAGNIVQKYAPPRNKGIDIAGNEGDTIVAAADGKVVYAGDGIRAYGNLLIIRHNDDYLTTYAHNQTLLVTEGAQVKQGQPVAKMGKTGTDSVKLHFEVRYKGQPIDPIGPLPDR